MNLNAGKKLKEMIDKKCKEDNEFKIKLDATFNRISSEIEAASDLSRADQIKLFMARLDRAMGKISEDQYKEMEDGLRYKKENPNNLKFSVKDSFRKEDISNVAVGSD